MFSVIYAVGHIQALYAVCHYVECHYVECRGGIITTFSRSTINTSLNCTTISMYF
jgi:hypothetical protein